MNKSAFCECTCDAFVSPRALVKASIRAVSTSSLWAAAGAAPAGVPVVPLLLAASWATAGGAVVGGAVFGDDLGEAPLSAPPDFAPPEA